MIRRHRGSEADQDEEENIGGRRVNAIHIDADLEAKSALEKANPDVQVKEHGSSRDVPIKVIVL